MAMIARSAAQRVQSTSVAHSLQLQPRYLPHAQTNISKTIVAEAMVQFQPAAEWQPRMTQVEQWRLSN